MSPWTKIAVWMRWVSESRRAEGRIRELRNQIFKILLDAASLNRNALVLGLVSGRKLVFFAAARGAGWLGDDGRAVFSVATPDLPKNTNASDTASVGFGWRFEVGRRQAASGSGSRRARCRTSNSRPMTCRL